MAATPCGRHLNTSLMGFAMFLNFRQTVLLSMLVALARASTVKPLSSHIFLLSCDEHIASRIFLSLLSSMEDAQVASSGGEARKESSFCRLLPKEVLMVHLAGRRPHRGFGGDVIAPGLYQKTPLDLGNAVEGSSRHRARIGRWHVGARASQPRWTCIHLSRH